jgi:hypothetical protein
LIKLPIPATLQAIAILFSQGGSNKKVPNTIRAIVMSPEGIEVEINKAGPPFSP